MNDQWTNEQGVAEHLLHLKQCAWFYGQYKVWNIISTLRVYLAEKEAIKQCLFLLHRHYVKVTWSHRDKEELKPERQPHTLVNSSKAYKAKEIWDATLKKEVN